METWCVLATGQSMSQQLADSVHGRCKVVAVSNAYELAPWADAMAAVDASWWRYHKEAFNFAGRKFTGAPDYQGLRELERIPDLVSGTNSGLFGVRVAVHIAGKPIRILLCGFNMRGTHYFGPHRKGLRNTRVERFEVFKQQFSRYHPQGVEIINCTPNSALTCYPTANLEDCLLGAEVHV